MRSHRSEFSSGEDDGKLQCQRQMPLCLNMESGQSLVKGIVIVLSQLFYVWSRRKVSDQLLESGSRPEAKFFKNGALIITEDFLVCSLSNAATQYAINESSVRPIL